MNLAYSPATDFSIPTRNRAGEIELSPLTPLIPTFHLFLQIIWNAIYFRFSRQKVSSSTLWSMSHTAQWKYCLIRIKFFNFRKQLSSENNFSTSRIQTLYLETDYATINSSYPLTWPKHLLRSISTAEGPVLITAGPGTGKTYTLIQRAIYLIEKYDVKPENIFIATFTEKAAKELITRVTNRLSNRSLIANINEMYIGTFHSLCLRILKDHLEFTKHETIEDVHRAALRHEEQSHTHTPSLL
mgnify:CR=1 FL=1